MQRQPTREHTAPTASPTAGPSKPYNEAAAIPPDDAYVSLDCEFVGIMSGAEHALAQVSVCDFNGSVLYSSYCQSDSPVVDYRSWVSVSGLGHLILCMSAVSRAEQLSILPSFGPPALPRVSGRQTSSTLPPSLSFKSEFAKSSEAKSWSDTLCTTISL